MKNIIINADDFGISKEVNKGIFLAHKKGVVTSTSITGNIRKERPVTNILRHCPKLGKGVHINLTLGKSFLSYEECPSLTNKKGWFYNDLYAFAFKLSMGLIPKRQIREEICTQIENVVSIAEVDHLDGHEHIHILPHIYPLALKLAKKYSIPFVRVPLQNINPLFFNRLPERAILNSLCIYDRIYGKHNYQKKIDYFCGFWHGGLNHNILAKIINSIRKGNCELMCHPSYPAKNLSTFVLENEKERVNDFNVLTDKFTKAYINKNKVKLVRFKDLE